MLLKKKKIDAFDIINNVLVLLITFVVMYPLYFCVIASVSDPSDVALGRTLLWVKNFTLEGYRLIAKEEQLWIGYRNSFFYTVLGTLYNLAMTIPLGYVMSKKNIAVSRYIIMVFLYYHVY